MSNIQRYTTYFVGLIMATLAAPCVAQWELAKKIVPQGVSESDHFGTRFSIDGNFAAVGNRYDDTFGTNAGIVYIYELIDNVWVEHSTLTPQSTDDFVGFGRSVAIDGKRLVVASTDSQRKSWGYVFELEDGQWLETSKVLNAGSSLVLDGDTLLSGVRVFENYFGFWVEVAKLQPSGNGDWPSFGSSRALGQDTILIGAPAMWGESAVFHYKKINGSWRQYALIYGGRNNMFGQAVAIGPGILIIGIPGNPELSQRSIVRIYDPINRDRIATLSSGGGSSNDSFGNSLDIEGETLIIGAPYGNLNGNSIGAAYIFTGADDTWEKIAQLSPDEAERGDSMGKVVAISGDTALLGAPGDDDNGNNAGAVYLYHRPPPCPADFDGNGLLDSNDLTAFLAAWMAGDPLTDWTNDDLVNTKDCIAYLNDWATGCP